LGTVDLVGCRKLSGLDRLLISNPRFIVLVKSSQVATICIFDMYLRYVSSIYSLSQVSGGAHGPRA